MIQRSLNASTSQWVAAAAEFAATAARLRRVPAVVGARSLAEFVRPDDHFLPLSVLALSVDVVGRLPFDELRRLPGVGLVKIRNLQSLLHRVLEFAELSAFECPAPAGDAPLRAAATCDSTAGRPGGDVTMLRWSHWCAALDEAGKLDDPLGRHAARLDDLPRHLWEVPLACYAALSLDELRTLKGYGPRRIGTIVEIFRGAAALAEAARRRPGCVVTCDTCETARADAWLVAALAGAPAHDAASLVAEVVEPLVARIRDDLGEGHAAAVAESALPRPGAEESSLRRLSASRIHQIRQDVAAAVRVRWPRGERLAQAYLALVAGCRPAEEAAAARRLLVPFFPSLARAPTPRRGDGKPSATCPADGTSH